MPRNKKVTKAANSSPKVTKKTSGNSTARTKKAARLSNSSATRGKTDKLVTIDDLAFDERNARVHGEANEAATRQSLKQFGAARSIVLDKNNVIRAGNGTAKQAKELGIPVRIVCSDGNELIAVKRVDLDGQAAAAYAIADNRTAELATWNNELLTKQLGELAGEFDIEGLGFSESALRALAGEPEQRSFVAARNDDPEALQKEWKTELGQVWEIKGTRTHRLMCGDSTDQNSVKRLLGRANPFIMVTDPPYGVEYDPEWRERELEHSKRPRRTGTVTNDDEANWTDAYRLFPGVVAYVWHAGRFSGELVSHLAEAKFAIRSQIIWLKPRFAISRGHYHWQHEPCWYAVRQGSAKWCGDRSQSTIWDITNRLTEEEIKTDHGTQKPLECMARPIRNHGEKDDHVYDPFLGSGTTMLAAEQLERQCYGMELSPGYCAVILQRMVDAGCKCTLKK